MDLDIYPIELREATEQGNCKSPVHVEVDRQRHTVKRPELRHLFLLFLLILLVLTSPFAIVALYLDIAISINIPHLICRHGMKTWTLWRR